MNMKPSVCIDAVFEGVSTEEAIRQVAELGCGAIEFWCWWEKDIKLINGLCAELGLAVAACCTKFVSLVQPEMRGEYLAGLEESIAAAKQLGCSTLISQVGDFVTCQDRQSQRESLVAGLKESAKLLDGSGVTLAIEPLNELVDHAGYYLIRSDEAFEIIDHVGSSSVKVTFDIYHQQISEGHLIHNVATHIDKIAHFHAAGNPGRHELDCGEIHYPEIIRALKATNYAGYFGLEYWPKRPAAEGLSKALELFQ